MILLLKAQNRKELLEQIADFFNFTPGRKKFFVGCTDHYWSRGYIDENILALVHKYPWALSYRNMNASLHEFMDRGLYTFKSKQFSISADLLNLKKIEVQFRIGEIIEPVQELLIPLTEELHETIIAEPVSEAVNKINPRYAHLIK